MLILVISLFVVSCGTTNNVNDSNNSTVVSKSVGLVAKNYQPTKFKYYTEDGFEINGIFNDVKESTSIAILLHGENGKSSDYDALVEVLNENSVSTITVDLRGHGKSRKRNDVDVLWSDLLVDDYKKIVLDIDGILNFLESKNISKELTIVGSDISANAALEYSAKTRYKVDKLILLSPSLNYYGILTKEVSKIYDGNVYFVASSDDENSYESSKTLYDVRSHDGDELKFYVDAGHGTMMLIKQPGLNQKISMWVKN